MLDKPAHPSKFDPATLAQLACPACHGELRSENSGLHCTACGRAYPITDGIPVLIIERAQPPGEKL